jgi:glutamate-ammonia-ligase adenylyltransferase
LYSRFVQRLHRRYADELPLLPPGPPTQDSLNVAYDALQAKGLDTSAALRVLRQLTLERLAQLDCTGQANLETVTHGMTWLAEVTLDIAWQQVMADLDALHGAPTQADGQRAEMWIVGMGKLGARELNVSSDIDLIYVYD